MKIAINGFGRIGRQFFQAALEKGMLKDIVAINDIASPENLAYLLKYDSVHPVIKEQVSFDKNSITVGKQKIQFFTEKDPSLLPWKKLNIDLVVEASGVFTKKEDAKKHLDAGAKRVLISAPATDPDITIILGVNHNLLKKEHKIISMASCTSNCIVPIVKVLNDNFKVESGYMVTTHAFTADQRVVDAPHKDFRRGRTSAVNIVPTSTGAAKMVGEVIPELKGKLDGYALRVPVPDGSICNFTCIVKKQADQESINKAFENASKKELKGVLEYCLDPIVSSDVIHNQHSCIFDSLLTKSIGNMINVIGWYDNEWGYSCRLADVAKLISKL
ncbi:MAG: type I glyceraldehyde-3-phosphate dehydrogenase [Candidatus Nanoarchaeia archaeon]